MPGPHLDPVSFELRSSLRSRRRLLRACRNALVAFAALVAPANAAAAAWSCWYDGESGILCVATSPPAATVAMSAIGPAPGARNPSGADTTGYALVRAESPARWPWKFVRIPILGVPTDIEGLRPLARSVMCGREPDCHLRLGLMPDIDALVALEDD